MVTIAVPMAEGENLADFRPTIGAAEQGIMLITNDGDFRRLSPLVNGFRYAGPWPAVPTP